MTEASDRTMFEIYRENDYNRQFRYIFYTDLEEHARDSELAKAASGTTVFTGFLSDQTKEQARQVVETIVDELNDLDEDEASIEPGDVKRRLASFLVDNPRA